MKKILFIILIIVTGCVNTDHDKKKFNFIPNSTSENLFSDYKDIVMRYDFSIIFFYHGDAGHSWYKVFALRDNQWEKIEIRKNIGDEEALKEDTTTYIFRDITTRKLCSQEEAQSFLSKLQSYGIFELPEEEVLRQNCTRSTRSDVSTTYIEMVSGDQVRALSFNEIYWSRKHCPNIKEWDRIIHIKDLFETEWFENSRGR